MIEIRHYCWFRSPCLFVQKQSTD